jgi:hypothetical protein
MGPSASRRPGPTTCCRHLAGSSYARKRQGGVLSFDTHAIIRSMRQGNCKGNKRSSRPIWGAQPPVTVPSAAFPCVLHSLLDTFPRPFRFSTLFQPIPRVCRMAGPKLAATKIEKLPNEPILKMTPSLSISDLQAVPLSGPKKTNPFCLSLRPCAAALNRTDAGPKPSARYRQHVAPERRVALGFPPVTPQRPRRSGTSTIVANRAESCLVVAQKYFFRSLTS